MPKNKSKIFSSSESDEESVDKRKEILQAHQENDESDLDTDDDDIDENRKLASSTVIEATSLFTVKLELTQLLRQLPISKQKHSYAIKKLPWNEIKIKGYSTEELQKLLKEIVKATGNIRTLDEILADYVTNHVRKDRNCHPDYPAHPANPGMRYLMENREKIEKSLEAANGEKPKYTMVFKHALEKFRGLSDKKKEKYLKAYEASKLEFKAKKLDFFKQHPELLPKRKKKTKEEPEFAQLTPFNHYREQLSKKGNTVSLAVAQKMWKNLKNSEKGKYISEVANMESKKEKKISKPEWKILNEFNGFPEKPTSSYTIFMKKFKESYLKKGNNSYTNFVKDAAKEWGTLPEREKQKYQLELDEQMIEWRKEMEIYIKKQPVEQQPMLFVKYNVGTTKEKAKKRKADTTTADDSQMSDKKIPKAEKVEKKITEVETSPRKKKNKIKEPVYPSQTTAHYFMQNYYEGKASKIGKAYRRLEPLEKRKYRDEMKSRRKTFLVEVGNYIGTLSPIEVTNYQLKMKQLKAKQKEETEWHVSTGTDDEAKKAAESSSESSSDDSNSS